MFDFNYLFFGVSRNIFLKQLIIGVFSFDKEKAKEDHFKKKRKTYLGSEKTSIEHILCRGICGTP